MHKYIALQCKGDYSTTVYIVSYTNMSRIHQTFKDVHYLKENL